MGWFNGRAALANELLLIKARQDTIQNTLTNGIDGALEELNDALGNVRSNAAWRSKNIFKI